jgi:hypothetical protein
MGHIPEKGDLWIKRRLLFDFAPSNLILCYNECILNRFCGMNFNPGFFFSENRFIHGGE